MKALIKTIFVAVMASLLIYAFSNAIKKSEQEVDRIIAEYDTGTAINWAHEFKESFETFSGYVKSFIEFKKNKEAQEERASISEAADENGEAESSYEAPQEKSAQTEAVLLEQVTLVHISDGDTINVIATDGFEYRVRLIGIDTPESVNPDETKNNEYGTMASEYTKSLLAGVDTLYLEYDEQLTDTYGRVLAYVWLNEDTAIVSNMLNAKILQAGYAVDKVYEPNDKYALEFKVLRNSAQASGTGLWQYDGYRELTGDNR